MTPRLETVVADRHAERDHKPILNWLMSRSEVPRGAQGVSCQDGQVEAVAEVLQVAATRAAPLGAGDVELLGLLREDFRLTTHVGQVVDRDEYICRNSEGVAVWRSRTLGTTEVAILCDTAVLLTVVTDVMIDAV